MCDRCYLPVLDGVLGAAGQQLGDLAPAVAEVPLRLVDDDLLVAGPVALLDGRVQVVEPTLSALLADASWQLEERNYVEWANIRWQPIIFIRKGQAVRTCSAMVDHLTLATPSSATMARTTASSSLLHEPFCSPGYTQHSTGQDRQTKKRDDAYENSNKSKYACKYCE